MRDYLPVGRTAAVMAPHGQNYRLSTAALRNSLTYKSEDVDIYCPVFASYLCRPLSGCDCLVFCR
jgi:hypothetical protein